MKIRQRTLINNLTVGMIPLVLITVIMMLINIKSDHKHIQESLDNRAQQFQSYLDIKLENYRDYSYFIVNQGVSIISKGANKQLRMPASGIFINRYDLRLFEVFLSDSLIHRNLYYWKDKTYSMPQDIATYIWKKLDVPIHNQLFTMSFPFIVSNTIVIYNCAIFNQPGSSSDNKIGFSSIATPLDKDLFQYILSEDSTGTYFIQHNGSMKFSDDMPGSPELQKHIEKLYQKDHKQYIPMKYKGEYYYIYRQPLLKIPVLLNGEINSYTQSYLGILINQDKLNRESNLFRLISLLSLAVSLILLLIISIWYTNKLTRPIQELQEQIDLFDKFREPMSPTSNAKDEIGDLHASFSKLSAHILIKNAEIEDERNKLHAQNQNMLADMEIARKIQNSLLPQISPSRQIYYYYKPMQQVGGDFFDFVPLPSGKVGFFISDVSGHGVPAALITAMLKSFILQNRGIADLPAIFLLELNKFLWEQTGGNFVTALYGVFDPYLMTFTYANAGHPHPLLVRDNTILSPLSNNRKPPIGIMNNQDLNFSAKEFSDYTMQLLGNDFLLLYTDGILEAVNYERSRMHPNTPLEEFGEVKLCETILKHSKKTNIELVNGIINDLVIFRGNDNFDDDVCIICLNISEQQTPLHIDNQHT